jgi:hypothetical protein
MARRLDLRRPRLDLAVSPVLGMCRNGRLFLSNGWAIGRVGEVGGQNTPSENENTHDGSKPAPHSLTEYGNGLSTSKSPPRRSSGRPSHREVEINVEPRRLHLLCQQQHPRSLLVQRHVDNLLVVGWDLDALLVQDAYLPPPQLPEVVMSLLMIRRLSNLAIADHGTSCHGAQPRRNQNFGVAGAVPDSGDPAPRKIPRGQAGPEGGALCI